tara:strand:+ start:543 stop:887 length:345 start_codon:yes stop_codon:yes gene_type:complete
MDNERRGFLKLSLKLMKAAATLAATYPLSTMHQEKVYPVVQEDFSHIDIPNHIDFSRINSLIPKVLASSAIVSLIMMYADTLQTMPLILISSIAMLLVGIQITELTISYFQIKK